MMRRRLAYSLVSIVLSAPLPSAAWAQAAFQAQASAAPQAGPTLVSRKPQPHLAFADATDPNPGSGRGLILTGWIGLGIAALAVAQGPLCSLNSYDAHDGQRRCVRSSVVIGAVALTLSVPALMFGYRRRRARNDWEQRHGLSLLAERISISADRRSFLFGYGLAEF